MRFKKIDLKSQKLLAWILAGSSMLAFSSRILADESESQTEEVSDEKNPEDPTKVVTRIGAGYNGEFTINGSFGIDKARMISGFVNSDASEWRLGGSWLFEKGIVNFNFKKNQYDSGGSSINYNVGTFIPLKVFGIEPCGWQIFPNFGLNYTEGDILSVSEMQSPGTPVLVPIDSKGVYLGAFALRPINDKWTFMCGTGGSYGSGDTTNIYAGTGVSFRVTTKQSLNLFYSVSESSDFGGRNTLGVNYKYEF